MKVSIFLLVLQVNLSLGRRALSPRKDLQADSNSSSDPTSLHQETDSTPDVVLPEEDTVCYLPQLRSLFEPSKLDSIRAQECYKPWPQDMISDAIAKKVVYVALFGQTEYTQDVAEGTAGALECHEEGKETKWCVHPDWRATGTETIMDLLWAKQIPFYNPHTMYRVDAGNLQIAPWSMDLMANERAALVGAPVITVYVDESPGYITLFEVFNKLRLIMQMEATPFAIIAYYGASSEEPPDSFKDVFRDSATGAPKTHAKHGTRMMQKAYEIHDLLKKLKKDKFAEPFAEAMVQIEELLKIISRADDVPDVSLKTLWKLTTAARDMIHNQIQAILKDSGDSWEEESPYSRLALNYFAFPKGPRPSEKDLALKIEAGVAFVQGFLEQQADMSGLIQKASETPPAKGDVVHAVP